MSTATAKVALVGALAVGFWARAASAELKGNANCPGEEVFFDPGNGEDVVLPQGYKIEVFAKGLNFPTDVVFAGGKDDFKVYVLESGTGLPGKCNNRMGYGGDVTGYGPTNPFTPDILVFDSDGRRIGGPLYSIAAYTMKHPPRQIADDIARERVEKFISGEIER